MTVRTTRTRLGVGVAALALAGTGLGSVATADSGSAPQQPSAPTQVSSGVQAEAQQTASCAYPYVCFFKGGKKTGQFKDVGSWQKLGKSKGATKMYNSRKDDRVFTHFTNGKQWCTPPRTWTTFNAWKVDRVYIGKKAKCPGK